MQTNAAVVDERFVLKRGRVVTDDFGESVRHGLTAPRKRLEPRFFYDELGSALFEAICALGEYYVTRAETEVLTTYAAEIARSGEPPARVVELGSGSARKTRYLLDAFSARRPDFEYVPVDVDAQMLDKSGQALVAEYPSLRVTALESDFRAPSEAMAMLPRIKGRTLVLFLGSSIGNLDPDEAAEMLADLRSALSPGDGLFLGADLKKDRAILEPAYDDPVGVTAAFNLNLLQRINRELGGTFNLRAFQHRALFNEELGRVEMHLVSRERQTASIAALGLEVELAEGETIHTESSYKYDRETLAELARRGGFSIAESWTDARGWFADLLLTV
jgi:L-histidine N-alpha-methyltransferase